MASCLEDVVPMLVRRDIPSRLETFNQLDVLLSDPGVRVGGEAVDRIVDSMNEWMGASNFKVTLYAMEILSSLIDRLESHFHKHVPTVLAAVRDRLGDNKDQVREEARRLLLRMMVPASSPQLIWERCVPSLTGHKLPRVREELLVLLHDTLNNYGHQSLHLSKLVPHVLKLLDDVSTPVRDAAYNTMIEIYRHVGERVRHDLLRKGLPPHKLQPLFDGFDDVRDQGLMIEHDPASLEAQMSRSVSSAVSTDETDFARPAAPKPPRPRHSSATTAPSLSSVTSHGSVSGGHLAPKRSAPRAASVGHKEAGAVDIEVFEKAFSDFVKPQVYSSKELNDLVSRLKDVIGGASCDWEKRIDAIKEVRGLFATDVVDMPDFPAALRVLEPCMQQACKDLRSQVVREACITVAFGAVQLKQKFSSFAECVLPTLINLIQNSAKIMATSGAVGIRLILLNVHSARLIPILTGQLTSKSRDIRRSCCDVLALVLSHWPTRVLEKHALALGEAIGRGVVDADPEARAHARRAYWAFNDHFPDQAQILMNSLDAKNQKILNSELSRTSSSNSLNSAASASAALGGSARGRGRHGSVQSSAYGVSSVKSGSRRTSETARPRMGYTRTKEPTAPASVGRSGRSYRVSQSQPSSRSTSPTSKSSYITYNTDTKTPRRSGIPRSQGTSRESSPGRTATVPRRTSNSSSRGYGSRAQRVLPHGPEGEQVVRDALNTTQRAAGRRYDQYDSDDACSEVSVGSDMSYGAGSRASERGGLGGYRLTSPDVQGVPDAIILLGSSLWSERRQGLTALSNLLNAGKNLSRPELRRVTDLFTRMFHDPHGKVFSAFLDTLQDLVKTHRTFLYDWLSVLLPRLLTRSGQEMLGSVAAKLQRTLDVVRECFPSDRQFMILCKFIIDHTSTTNIKVKLSLLQYLLRLTDHMDPTEFNQSGDTRVAVARIVQWCSEPKSSDMRKTAQEVLVALFNLNTPEFSALLSQMPKTAQDAATRVLKTTVPRQQQTAHGSSHGHGDIYESIRQATADIQSLSLDPESGDQPPEHTESQDSGIHTLHDPRAESPDRPTPYTSNVTSAERAYNPAQYSDTNGRGRTPYSTGVSPGLGISPGLHPSPGLQASRSPAVQASPSLRGQPCYSNSPYSTHSYQSPAYDPNQTSNNSVNGYNKQALAEALFDDDELIMNEALTSPTPPHKPPDVSDPIQEILAELSNHNTRYEERKAAMTRLVSLCKDHADSLWDENFKTVLLILLETMGDTDAHIRAQAVTTLKELVTELPDRFTDYVELTVLRVTEAHRDPIKEVVRSAEECASAVASSIPASHSMPVVAQIAQHQQYPVSLAAIKMLNKVIDSADKQTLEQFCAPVMRALLKAYDDVESTVRKAAVFCIVSIYLTLGEACLRPHLDHLNSSKMKLLNLYIKRAESHQSASDTSSARALSADS